ncbi:hypothetical protein Tco_0171018, partial [Tanacetum coccineum]
CCLPPQSFGPCVEEGLDVPALANVPSCVVPERHAVSESSPITSQDHHTLTPGVSHDAVGEHHLPGHSSTSGLPNSRNCIIGERNLPIHSRNSGPPSDYKHIGNCSYSCQHCGALFWYEERIKNSARAVTSRSSLFRQHQGLQSNVQYDVVRRKS